uniref:Lipoprotein n=1 Tax=Caulobacter sp. (strain K31) TaxID=366602 RepID=B0T0R5_CAUSK
MNDETGKIARLGELFRGAALIGLLAGLAACASPFTPPPADPSSPLAAAVNAAAKDSKHARKPSFAEIPAIPTDVRTPVQFKKAVGAEKLAAEKLKRDTAPSTWTLSGTEAYASKARDVAKVPASDIPTDADRAATEAFAKAARDRATAPPSKPQ